MNVFKPVLVIGTLALTLTHGLDPVLASDEKNVNRKVVRIALPGTDTFPEGILETPDGDLLITGFGNGSILRVEPHLKTTRHPTPTPGVSSKRPPVYGTATRQIDANSAKRRKTPKTSAES
ncbi:MAG: hypothetical protein AAF449_07120, partial [Myxococcota bacterium]